MLTIQLFSFSPLEENTYVLFNEQRECCIIDPGCYFGNERRALQEFIVENNLQPKYLLNTHCHLDHVFGNKFVNETWQLIPHLHQDERVVLDFAEQAGQRWGLPFSSYKGEVEYLAEGDEVKLGNDVLKVILAPGHSPGHICFYCEAQKFVIGGDVLFKMSIGRTDLPGGSHDTLLQSIRQKLFVLPDDVIVYTGHGDPTTIGFEKKYNPFLNPETIA